MLEAAWPGLVLMVGTAPPGRRSYPGGSGWLRKDWDDHVDDLELMANSPGFLALRELIIKTARLGRRDRVLDIGAGTGLLALAAAPLVASVSAVDLSPAMCRHLAEKFHTLGLNNAEVMVSAATHLPLPDSSIDVAVSNYCFHHLTDVEKRRALSEIRRVLRPGGRLVFGDMMFRLGIVDSRDRAVIGLLIRRVLRHGPAGVLRLLKSAARILTFRWEHPASAGWWHEALLDAGFVDVEVRALEHEGGVAHARKREQPGSAQATRGFRGPAQATRGDGGPAQATRGDGGPAHPGPPSRGRDGHATRP
ncbi:MAG TPA: methyltransferase domain-containing protein [Solirubrobacteraceae bacterium]|nr:methyltransferase domain-containing protein [Solirubrobacteraceae bacterium]